jgi:hypothetical protein
MDQDERRYDLAATQQGLSLWRNDDDGTWSVQPAPNMKPSGEPVDTIIAGDRIRLADGRIFPRRMTTEQLEHALGLDT